MGMFDRIRSLMGGSGGEGGSGAAGAGDDGRSRTVGGQPGIDRGAGSRRAGVDPDDDRKTGAHGAHWDAVVATDEEIREATVEAVREGETLAGRPVDGREVEGYRHPPAGPVRTCAVATDGSLTTAYPTADGIEHEVTVTEVIEWANDLEAQVAFELSDRRAAAFDAGYFRPASDYGPDDAIRMELAGLAYELGPPGEGEVAGGGVAGGDAPGGDPVAFVGFDGGDVDDYLFRTRVESVGRSEYRGRDVYGLRVPFSAGGPEIALYAVEHVLDGYVPEPDDEVEGVLWLQGWVAGSG